MSFIQDLRYALRAFRRAPGFTAASVATLALGIAASTAVFTVVNGVLLKPLPYPGQDRLVRVWETNAREDLERSSVSPGNVADWRARSRTFDGWAIYYARERTLTEGDEPERIRVARASPALFDLLGARPVIGRSLTPEDGADKQPREALISYDMWRVRFGGDPDVLRRSVFFEGRPDGIPIVGVMPQGFGFPDRVQVWTPEFLPPAIGAESRAMRYHEAVARLRPGASLSAAQAELAAIQAQLAAEHPQINSGWGVRVEPLREATVGQYRLTLLTLLATVWCLLVIGCVNVANLMLARVVARRRELGVRIALGADRWRLVRLLIVESLTLGIAGGALGCVASLWLVRAMLALLPSELPRMVEIAIDPTVLTFSAAVSLLSVVLVGLAPAVRASRLTIQEWLNDRGAPPPRRGRARDALIACEVALTLVVLVAAGLFFQTFVRLRQVDLGFHTQRVLVADVSVPVWKFRAAMPRPWYLMGQFYRRLLDDVRHVPGVIEAAASTRGPLDGEAAGDFVWAVAGPASDFQRPASATDRISAAHNVVTPNYFKVLGIPLRAGRSFGDRDARSERALTEPTAPREPRVVIVNETLARRLWPGEDPIGKRLADESYHHILEVVGVVADVRDTRVAADPEPQVYEPYLQNPPIGLSLLIATAGDPNRVISDLRARLRAFDRDVVVSEASSLETIAARSIASPRFTLVLVGAFATLAIVLSTVGLYGAVAYVVAQQTRELGIRAALGATSRDLVSLVVSGGMWPVAVGLFVGIAGALATGRLIRGLLFGVAPTDPVTLAATSTLFLVVAFCACLVSGRRAARVDPVIALRSE